MKFNSGELIRYLKIDCSIEVDDLTVAWIYSETGGSPWSWPCSHAMNTLDHWFETQVQLFFQFYICTGPGLVIIFGNAIDTEIISSALLF